MKRRAMRSMARIRSAAGRLALGGLLLAASPLVAEPPAFRCSASEAEIAVEVSVVHQAAGELHVAWTLPIREPLWEYEVPDLPGLDSYRRWLAARQSHASGETADAGAAYPLEKAINRAVARRELGTLRPMNCLEAWLLETQVARGSVEKVREFVAYVLRHEESARMRIYFLSGPGEYPPKDIRIRPLLKEDLESDWWLYSVIHNHTGDRPVAAPSAADAQYGLAWAAAGARRFIVLDGMRAFDMAAAELRELRLEEPEPAPE